MASKLSGIELTRYDDLFKTDAEREADRQERIQIVPAAEVFPYSRQPYTIDWPRLIWCGSWTVLSISASRSL